MQSKTANQKAKTAALDQVYLTFSYFLTIFGYICLFSDYK